MIVRNLTTGKQTQKNLHQCARSLGQGNFFPSPTPLWAGRNPIRTASTASRGNGSQVGGKSQVVLHSHLVVAVPDASIQEMLRMFLHLRGYRVSCTPIDRFHPLGWIAQARNLQPDAVIVDVDLFRYLSVQESILTVVQAWELGSGIQPPAWVWLSRRPVEGSAALRMPFHLAELDARLRQGCRSTSAGCLPL